MAAPSRGIRVGLANDCGVMGVVNVNSDEPPALPLRGVAIWFVLGSGARLRFKEGLAVVPGSGDKDAGLEEISESPSGSPTKLGSVFPSCIAACPVIRGHCPCTVPGFVASAG